MKVCHVFAKSVLRRKNAVFVRNRGSICSFIPSFISHAAPAKSKGCMWEVLNIIYTIAAIVFTYSSDAS